MNKQDLEEGLKNFYGTENWYRHGMVKGMLYTDGVQFFAQNAGGGAYWFLDEIAFNVFPLRVSQPFMLVELRVNGSSADIVVTDGDNQEVYRQHLNYTDCPEGDWKFFLTDNVLLLTSEY